MAATYYEGTILPAENLEVEKASERLRKAMKMLGTDERVIIDILASHCNTQRQLIKTQYKTSFGRDLIDDLQDELGGHFETLCLYLFMPSRVFDAVCLRNAMCGLGTKESTLIEILVSRSATELTEIKENYKVCYNRDLEEEILEETSGDLERILVSLLQGKRSQEPDVDLDRVKQDAEELFNAGEGNRFGTDESVFNKVLVVRSIGHLRKLFEEYPKHDDKEIEGAIVAETSGNVQKAFLAVVKFIKDPLNYFAECFHETFKGPGTDDERLMQLVVSHCEVDLQDIKKAYFEKYNTNLKMAIQDETSGDYQKLLDKLVGE